MVYGVKWNKYVRELDSLSRDISKKVNLLVAFYHEFKDFVQFSVIGMTEYFLAVHLAVRAERYATVCLQDKDKV